MQLMNDVSLAVRQLVRQRAYSAVALTTIALSIAATAVVFSVTYGVLVRPLPFPAADRLQQIHEVERDRSTGALNTEMYFAWQNYADIRSEVRSFESVTAFQYYDRTLTGHGSAVRLSGRRITPEFFSVFRVKPWLGRPFDANDAAQSRESVALLSHGVWLDRFGGDTSVVGRTVRLDGLPFTVVGIMPPRFDFPYGAELWMPLVPYLGDAGEGARRFHRYRVVGRLAPGATTGQAQSELTLLATRLAQSFPATNTDNGFRAVPLIESVAGEARPALRVLMSAVVLLLLIGCVNVAGLQLVQSAGREREIGIRIALGAARGRLVRQLLVESVVLALAGGVAGLLLSSWGLQGFKMLLGDALPRAEQVKLDGYGIAFTVVITLLTGVLFGVLPALRSSRPRMSAMLRGSRGVASDRSLTRLRGALVVAEVAIAIVLASGSALLVRSFQHLRAVESVTEPHTLFTVTVSLPETRYGEPAQTRSFYSDLLQRIEALLQVSSAAAALAPPLADGAWGNQLHIEGRAVPANERPIVGYVIITPGYFRTAGIPLLEGRDFDAVEAETRPAVIVNRALARRHWPSQSPLGQRVRFSSSAEWATVVGVAADVAPRLGAPVEPEAYVPTSIETLLSMTLLIRAQASTAVVLREVRALIAALDRDVPVTRSATLEEQLAESVARPRYTAAIVTLFAVAALFLAAVGIYGVLAYAVSQRSRELGIRMAVGASTREILALVLRDGARLAALGIGIGLTGSLLANQVLREMLYGISATDPATIVLVLGVTFIVTLLASWLPARRAARIAPASVLSRE